MPETTIPYVEQVIKYAEFDDPEAEDIIRSLLVSSYTVTPEIRFYLGHKRYSQGFYLSLFYRYGHYMSATHLYLIRMILMRISQLIPPGTVISHTVACCWVISGQSVSTCIDWQMFGPHYRVHSGDFLRLPSSPLSQQIRQTLRKNF
jgi:hypothetical protein